MSRTVLITGANRGIGFALCEHYVNNGDEVLAVCRTPSEQLSALSGVTIIDGVDVSVAEDLARLKSAVGDKNIDILINNAGILSNESLGAIDVEAIEKQFMVNAIAPILVTEALMANLSAGSKVAMITSRMGSIADNGSGGYYGYRMSKTALNMAGVSLAKDLAPKEIAVALLHPGFVQTDMVNHAGDISANTAAKGLVQRIEELTLETSGGFWHSNGESLPW
ncbi:SDR family oxidoreductase [Teredinibacter sp. KSP-S5-2]|uniref:SDR family oxidoreductase n=1 Tax=Teredinibacter sp. KSP-S5-2 TaxID=3034506 RepID=UPI0029350C01|nr:SDR family oxidoreductase [Teredinibacter sp. KSP-S5-2]WNO08937.1 SDR family oxidoreductase [Teredinibacter sp. KSP-S5-2]